MSRITDALSYTAYNIDTSNMLVFFVCYVISMKRKIINLTQAQINELKVELQEIKRMNAEIERRWQRGVRIRPWSPLAKFAQPSDAQN